MADWINKKKSIENILSKFPLDNPLIEGSPHQDFIKIEQCEGGYPQTIP